MTPPRDPRDIFVYVDETGTDKDSKFVALACAVVDAPDEIRARVTALRAAVEGDYFLQSFRAVEKIRRKGFHFTIDHPEIRSTVIAALKDLSFDGYVCFARRSELELDAEFEWYRRLLECLLFDRFRDNVHNSIYVVVEQLAPKASTVARQTVSRLTESIQDQMRPFATPPSCILAGKDETCLLLPDYLAGIFREAVEKPGDTTCANFQRMRPRIRLVHDVQRAQFYSRRNEMPIPLPL